MSRALLVDDGALLTELLTEYLTAEGLSAHSVPDGEAGVHETLTGQYDVIALDSMMPKMNSLDVLKSARSQSIIPVIMLTAKGDDIDRIIGLEIGADGYMPKPCTPRGLLARINAILRRVQHGNEQNNAPDSASISDVVLYPAKRQATIREEPLELASIEFNLLEVLIHRAERVVSEGTLSIETLDRELAKFDRDIDVHISSIRHKLGDASLTQTVRGLGYLFIKNQKLNKYIKLFRRIFATFCTIIICAIFVANFSSWLIQNTLTENQFNQRRTIGTTLVGSMVSAFRSRGDNGAREIFNEWEDNPVSGAVFVILDDGNKGILDRDIGEQTIERTRAFAINNPNSDLARIEYGRFGEGYLFFTHDWGNQQAKRLPSPLSIPSLSLAPVWHEFIILSFIIIVGLLMAYILTNSTTKPTRILGNGMDRPARGELQTHVSQQVDGRDDELSHLAIQFDRMAAQLEKFVAKERHLLHHISHEIRSPLARMQAIVDLIQAQPQKQKQYLKRLEGELTRMDILVGELLALSRLEISDVPLKRESLTLVPFLTSLVEDCQAIAQQNKQTISLRIDAKVPQTATIMASENYLYHAFGNVIRNATNYSPRGSTISVSIKRDSRHWPIDVTDNSPGVDEMQLPHIFTAFYRTDSNTSKSGTGLGLALTQHIMEQHCGKITAENVKPNGLRMHLVLPKE